MSAVWKHPRSPFWTGIYRDAAGRWRRYSTKERSQAAAKRIVQKLEETTTLARERKLSREAYWEECRRGSRILFGEHDLPTVRLVCENWLRSKNLERAEPTALRYTGTVTRFLKYLGPRAAGPLSSISPADCQGFYNLLLEQKLSPATRVVEMKTLRTIFNVARRQQLVTFNPAEAVELPSHIQQVKRRTFTPAQVEIILREAADAKDLNGGDWTSAILFGYYAAMRLGDAVSRRWEEVDLTARTLEFQDRKTRKQIVIPLHPRLEQHLAEIAGDANGFICPRLAKVTVGGRSGLSKQFASLLRRAGISQASQATGGQRMLATLSFHSLRKTFNSELYNAEVTQEVRKKLTGHKSDAVNDRYTESKLAPLRKAVDKLPKLARLNERQLHLAGLESDKK